MKIENYNNNDKACELNIGDIVEFTMDSKALPNIKYVRAAVKDISEKGDRFIINNGLDCHVCFVDSIFKINDIVIRKEDCDYILVFDSF